MHAQARAGRGLCYTVHCCVALKEVLACLHAWGACSSQWLSRCSVASVMAAASCSSHRLSSGKAPASMPSLLVLRALLRSRRMPEGSLRIVLPGCSSACILGESPVCCMAQGVGKVLGAQLQATYAEYSCRMQHFSMICL